MKHNTLRVYAFLLFVFLMVAMFALAEQQFLSTRYEYPLQTMSLPPTLQIQGGYFCVRVLDQNSQAKVNHAYVVLDWTFNGQGNDYALYTDANGEGKFSVPFGDYYVHISHPDYTDYVSPTTKTIAYIGETWFTFTITPSGGPGSGITVSIYMVDPYRKRIYTGTVTYNGIEYPVGQSGLVELYHVPTSTSVTLMATGQYMIDFWNWPQFSWQFTITTGTASDTWTLWVENGFVEHASPPAEPPDPFGWFVMAFTWLLQNWWIALILMVTIYFAPHIMSWLIAMRRSTTR